MSLTKRDFFREYSSGRIVNAEWLAVGANQTVYTPMVKFTSPANCLLFIFSRTPLFMKLYKTDGTELSTGDFLLSVKSPHDGLPLGKEICESEVNYEIYTEFAFAAQGNREIRESFVVKFLSKPYAFVKPEETFIISVKRNDLALSTPCHANTRLEYAYGLMPYDKAQMLNRRAELKALIEREGPF